MKKRSRIRVKSIPIGQVSNEIIEAYRKTFNCNRIHIFARIVIEKNILGRKVIDASDLQKATEIVNRMYYTNIGEYLEDYMRAQLIRYSKETRDIAIFEKTDALLEEFTASEKIRLQAEKEKKLQKMQEKALQSKE